MGLMKFATIGAITRVKNNPRANATMDMKNGYCFKIVDNYTSGGSKSKVDITVTAGTIASGNVTFNIGGQVVYTTINSSTDTTTALCAAKIKASVDAVLLGLNYTTSINTNVITINAPTNSGSTDSVKVDAINAGVTTLVLTPAITAGTDAVNYREAVVPFTDDADVKASDIYFADNVIIQPELWNLADFKIANGEKVNSYLASDMIGYNVNVSGDLVVNAYSSVNVGDVLVPVPAGSNQMMLKVATSTGYKCGFKVVDKIMFGVTGEVGNGMGFECKLVAH